MRRAGEPEIELHPTMVVGWSAPDLEEDRELQCMKDVEMLQAAELGNRLHEASDANVHCRGKAKGVFVLNLLVRPKNSLRENGIGDD